MVLKMNKKGFLPAIPAGIVGFAITVIIILLLVATIGGIGLTFSLFKGITSIPPFVLILIGVVIIMLLFRGKR